MKKIVKVVACAALALTITGCKNKIVPSNGEDNVVSLSKGDYKITVNDLYETLKDKYATNYIIQQIDSTILNKEYETDDDANQYVENQLKIYKMMYNNSDSELLSALQNAGYRDLEEFKETILASHKRNLATKDYVRENISEDKIKKYYDEKVYGETTISHILITVEASDTMTNEEKEEAQKKADDKIKEIYDKLDNGEKFSDIAKEYSDDAATKENGGRVGTFTKGEMTEKFNSEFEEAAMNLKVDNYTRKTVKSSYGYHIIYKDGQKDKPALETVKQTIIDNLIDDAMDEDSKAEYKAMIKLREKYGLEFNDENVKQQYDNAVNNWLYGKDE